jgi:glycosyltransferase involved in cell wall biosynthesis
MMVRVSVVVPTFRRPLLLQRCLKALAAQDLNRESYEVIVVDDGAFEDTTSLVEAFQRALDLQEGLPAVRYLASPRPGGGPAAARNLGWRVAKGEIVAFTDDDCVPHRGWLRAGLAAFTQGVAGASGRILMPLPASPRDYELNAARLEEAEFATANCFYRREALAAAGGFDERFTAAWREDSDLFFTLLEKRSRLVRVPGAVVIHPVRPAPWGVSLRQQKNSLFEALLYKKHRRLYRLKIRRSPSSYYLAVFALFLALGGWWGGWWWLCASGVMVWGYLTARFCVHRLRGTSRDPGHLAEMVLTSLLIPPLAVFWRLRGAMRFRVPFY